MFLALKSHQAQSCRPLINATVDCTPIGEEKRTDLVYANRLIVVLKVIYQSVRRIFAYRAKKVTHHPSPTRYGVLIPTLPGGLQDVIRAYRHFIVFLKPLK